MTRVPKGISARARIFSKQDKSAARPTTSSKRSWCCFSPAEKPSKENKLNNTLQLAPPTPAGLARPVSSGEAGSAPRILPMPSVDPAFEAQAFPPAEEFIDLRRWR